MKPRYRGRYRPGAKPGTSAAVARAWRKTEEAAIRPAPEPRMLPLSPEEETLLLKLEVDLEALLRGPLRTLLALARIETEEERVRRRAADDATSEALEADLRRLVAGRPKHER